MPIKNKATNCSLVALRKTEQIIFGESPVTR